MSRSESDREDIDAVLHEIRSLRLTLSSDLSAAAGAVDEHQAPVARDIIDADSHEVRDFSERLRARQLRHPSSRRRSRRALLALPAIPLVGALAVTAAAAMTGSIHGGSASHNAHQAPSAATRFVSGTATTTTAHGHNAAAGPTATLHRIEAAVAHHPQEATLMALSQQFHQQLSQMMQGSLGSVAQAAEVRKLLNLEQLALQAHPTAAVEQVLADTRSFAASLLTSTTSSSPGDSQPSASPPATSSPTTSPSPSGIVAVGPTHPSKHQHHHHAHPKASPTNGSSPPVLSPPSIFPQAGL